MWPGRISPTSQIPVAPGKSREIWLLDDLPLPRLPLCRLSRPVPEIGACRRNGCWCRDSSEVAYVYAMADTELQ
jgi:hypothetical protein